MKKEYKRDKVWLKIISMILVYKQYVIIITICSLLSAVLYFFKPLIIQMIIDYGFAARSTRNIYFFAGGLFITNIVDSGISIIQAKNFADLYNRFSITLHEKAFEKIYRIKYSFFTEKSSSEIINTVFMDINTVASLTNNFSTFSIASILQIIGGVIGLLFLDWKMTVVVLSAVPFKVFFVKKLSNLKEGLTKKSVENDRKYYTWLGDWINGIKEVKLWNLLKYSKVYFYKLQNERLDLYKKCALLDQYKLSFDTTLDNLLNCIFYVMGGLFIIKSQMTIGKVFAFITYSTYVLSPISFLIGVKYTFSKIKPSSIRLFDFLDLPEEDMCTKEKRQRPKRNVSIEFRNVSFSYAQEQKVLTNCELKIESGKTIGIIGKNGSGKSTIISLILGLYLPDKGEVLINGMSTSCINMEELRDEIAVVTQKPYLFDTTIAENINLGAKANEYQLKVACEKSGADQFIFKLSDGFQHRLGNGGIKLSGGERQKIAVARALLKKANIILLDEASEGYDIETSIEWRKKLRSEFVDKTVVIVTHRFEELDGVDAIYKLQEGKLYQVEKL